MKIQYDYGMCTYSQASSFEESKEKEFGNIQENGFTDFRVVDDDDNEIIDIDTDEGNKFDCSNFKIEEGQYFHFEVVNDGSGEIELDDEITSLKPTETWGGIILTLEDSEGDTWVFDDGELDEEEGLVSDYYFKCIGGKLVELDEDTGEMI